MSDKEKPDFQSQKTPPKEFVETNADDDVIVGGVTPVDSVATVKHVKEDSETPDEVENSAENAEDSGAETEPPLESEPAPKVKKDPPSKRGSNKVRNLMFIGAAILGVFVLALWGMWQSIEQSRRGWIDSQLVDYAEQINSLKTEIESLRQAQGDMQSSQGKSQVSLSEQIRQMDSRQGKVQTLIGEQRQGLATHKALLDQQAQRIDMLQQRIDAQQQRLHSLTTTSREDWLLAEAEYLLRLANQRVLLERHPQNAVALLERADNIVQQVSKGLGDADLFAIRQAITRELAALKLVPSVDREGLFLQLQALAEQIESLPRVPPTNLDIYREPESVDAQATENDGFWGKVGAEMASMLGVLDNYIRFDNAETPENPLIASHAAQVAALHVRVAIEQAQVALLKEEPSVYQTALLKADQIVEEFYYPSLASEQYRQQLKMLDDVAIAPELPDISSSLKLLNMYLERLHKLDSMPEGQL